ncbi:MAG: hypothetical protein M3P38_06625 [Chloroflexota bacterium]|nr:hypothetical protein [Chloroflexota bacterium]
MTAAGETDGVKLRLDLDRASVRSGETVWATVTIENTNDHPISWVGGGCNVPGRVTATIPAVADYGRNWTEYLLAELKKRLVIGVTSGGYVPFVDEASWNLRGQGGRVCTADIRAVSMAAHAKVVNRFAWDGTLRPGVSAPIGRVSVSAALDMNDERLMVGKSVSATAPLDLTSGSTTRVSPAQAVDAAFEEGRFAAWVRSHARADGYGQQTAYDVEGTVRLDADVWIISALQNTTSPASQIEVRVDARDAKVISVEIR